MTPAEQPEAAGNGFVFVGPTTVYTAMQTYGLVNDPWPAASPAATARPLCRLRIASAS